jgi:exodeoxyribonuclease V alpha subunit
MLFEPELEVEKTVLVGRVDRVVYRANDDGFAVLRLIPEDQTERVTAVGLLGALDEGEHVRMTGSWLEHARFGRQFKVESYQSVLPSTNKGIQAYLSRSGDIGPKIAERMVKHFGVNVLEILAKTPERVREVPGVGSKRAQSILASMKDDLQTREALIFLQGLGIPQGTTQRILQRYGEEVITQVRENPYMLAEDVGGIGFRTADRIAQSLGIPPTHEGRIRAGISHSLLRARDDGHLYVPRPELINAAVDLLEVSELDVESHLLNMVHEGVLIDVPGTEDWLGFPEFHELEREIASILGQLSSQSTRPSPNDTEIDFAQNQLGLDLDETQKDAIRTAIRAPMAVVTGGPGTGKTTILRGALALYHKRGLTVSLAAPTGRAARRLTETTGAEALTIHRLLEYSPKEECFSRNDERPLEADVVVIDEVSMVDVPLMASLCRAIRPEASLLLVGDADQLPSVGPGLVLHDVLQSERVPIVRLQHIYRQGDGSSIVANAHRILGGQRPNGPPKGEKSDFYVIHLDNPEDIRSAIEVMVSKRIPARFGLDPKTEIQVLVPMHRGQLGAEILNERLQALLNADGSPLPNKPGIRIGDRVIQTRNNYDLDVANGDVGIVQGPGAESDSIRVRFDKRDVTFPADSQDSLRLAYALSIHKSQGSEYPAVVIPIHTQHYMMLKRNLLYTAVTRGRSLVVLVGSPRAIGIAVQQHTAVHRYTRLNELLQTFDGA